MHKKGVRVSITLPREAVEDYKEVSVMTGFSVSGLIRRRLEVRGGVVAVPEPVLKELAAIHGLLEFAIRTGMYDPDLLKKWEKQIETYDRLVDFASYTTFLYAKPKRRASRPKEKDVASSKQTDASPRKNNTVASSESGAVGC